MEKTIIIYDKESYTTFNEKGGFCFHQDGDKIENNYYRKDRIVRRKRLPNWVLNALNDGKWVVVESFEVEGECPNFYLKIKGRAVTPMTKTESKVSQETFCDNVYSHAIREVVRERERKYYGDFVLPLSFYEGWKQVSSKVLKGLTRVENERFKAENPLPQVEKNEWEEVIDTINEYDFNDNDCIKKTINVMKPHCQGYYYCYAFNDDCKLYIQKNSITDCCSTYHKVINKETLQYVSKELVNSRIETRFSGEYESNDGMRMCRDIDTYNVCTYKVALSNGEEKMFDNWKFVSSN